MKKRKLILIVTFLCFSLIFFLSVFRKEVVVADNSLQTAEAITLGAGPVYYMKLDGSQVVIYNTDHSVYEYTNLDLLILPENLVNELIAGKYFNSQEELYEFLETYTS